MAYADVERQVQQVNEKLQAERRYQGWTPVPLSDNPQTAGRSYGDLQGVGRALDQICEIDGPTDTSVATLALTASDRSGVAQSFALCLLADVKGQVPAGDDKRPGPGVGLAGVLQDSIESSQRTIEILQEIRRYLVG